MSENDKERMAEITKRHRLLAGMTGEEFGAHLVERLQGARAKSKQNISLWERGEQSVPLYFAMLVYGAYGPDDLRGKWALEVLRVHDPSAWGERPVEVVKLGLLEKAALTLSNYEAR